MSRIATKTMGPDRRPRRQARPRLFGTLGHGWLHLLRARPGQGREPGSLVIILLAVLGILIGAGTLVSRTTQGQLGSMANSQTYGARKAAEAGISKLIGEWNQQRNRMLLASGSPASSWVTSNKWLRNPCTATTISLSSATEIGGPDLAAYRTGAWIDVVQNDTNDIKRRYRLRRVTYRKSNRQISTTVYTQTAFGTDKKSVPSGAKAFPDMSTNTSTIENPKPFTLGEANDSQGYLEVEVEGQVLRNGVVLASSRVVKEFQVVPKCCWRSYGRTLATGDPPAFEIYGNDWRFCSPPSGFTAGKLAMLTGLNGGGLVKDNGDAWSLRVEGLGKLNPIICTTAATTCDGPDGDAAPDASQVVIDSSDGNIGVTSFNIKIPDPPAIPTGGFTMGPLGSNSSQQVNGGNALKSEGITPQDDGQTGIISLPSIGLAQQGNTKYCGFRDGAYHCSISSIKLPGNKIIQVDTTTAPVYLYFQDPSGNIDIRGTAGLQHLYNGAPAAAWQADRLQIRGEPRNGNPSSQSFEVSGDSVNTAMFVWAPVSTLTFGGNATFKGITWVDNLGFYGNTNVTVPAPNGLEGDPAADVCPEILPEKAVYCRLFRDLLKDMSPPIPLAFDWVARSETYTKFYGFDP